MIQDRGYQRSRGGVREVKLRDGAVGGLYRNVRNFPERRYGNLSLGGN